MSAPTPGYRAQAAAREERLLLEALVQYGPLPFGTLHRRALPSVPMRTCDNAVRRLAKAGAITLTVAVPKRWSITDAGRARLGLDPLGARVGNAHAADATLTESLTT